MHCRRYLGLKRTTSMGLVAWTLEVPLGEEEINLE